MDVPVSCCGFGGIFFAGMIIDHDNKVDRPRTYNQEETKLKKEKDDAERKCLEKGAFLIGNKYFKRIRN
ncbi:MULTISPECIES: hypothetical protein [Bacillus cereus group]|nr:MULTISPECIES: hypothetical protein [Bacillus cereus group]MBJ8009305.1 hypothetical protein [Bacillus cereus]MBJ8073507.1 hypothetical protein [Bacillus cereus]MBJ8189735.1 hypothetical protein [Bacillus cereus]MDM5460141.1 hypothetical protein [Bacillus cereus]QWG36772.1 hypothetical protein EXW30_28745 [Bacillus mycoides]